VHPPSETVLIVDDDASIRLLCRVNLELEGWRVREAGSLREARARLATGDVHTVLLDVHLGSESGVALVEEIRRDHPRARVALLTGSVGVPQGEGASVDAVIPKPFTLKELVGTVRSLAG
jgi:DNA-binding response OmpR family regulator